MKKKKLVQQDGDIFASRIDRNKERKRTRMHCRQGWGGV
jgi:hypothetical protein